MQPREPAFWVFGVFVVYGAVAIIDVLGDLASVSRSGWALSWLLLALYAAPVIAAIYWLDLYEREPWSLVAGALAWGALVATALSLDAAGWDELVVRLIGADAAARWTPAIAAPLVEETLKGVGVVLLYLIARDEFDDVMDGFVYGAAVGLGFAVVEDVLYLMAVFGGTPAGVLQGFYIRVVSSGLYGHVLYTGLIGMGIGFVVTRRENRPLGHRLQVSAGLAGLGVAGHALWNAPILDLLPDPPVEGLEWFLVPVALAVKGLPMLVLVAVGLKLARGRERRWLDGALQPELEGGAISATELEVLRSPARRRAAVKTARARSGRRAGDLVARLQREQIDLAMVASRVARPDDPALVAQRAYCRSIRDVLAATPGAAPPDAPGPWATPPPAAPGPPAAGPPPAAK